MHILKLADQKYNLIKYEISVTLLQDRLSISVLANLQQKTNDIFSFHLMCRFVIDGLYHKCSLNNEMYGECDL